METIGRYLIEGELGKGAMGVVYRAKDPNIGRVVALKTMRLDVHGIEAEEMLQRFRNEARSAGVLNHPNIVTIYDAGEADGLFYMAMEVIEGETLQELLVRQRVLPVEQILSVTRQVAEGLDYAHGKGVIHRDIKPANIMITTSGLVKIMDFGIAKAGGGLTSTGQVLGTPNYMSPEQVKGKPLDGRSDLFSLGVCLYEMLTGEKPFGAQNVTTIIYKIVHEEPISPRELDVSIHPGLSAVVVRSLSKAIDARYQTGADLARDLENYKSFGSDLSATQTMQATIAANSTEIARAAATVSTISAPEPAPAAVAVAPQRVPVPSIEGQTIQRPPLTAAAKPKQQPAAKGNKGILWAVVALLVIAVAALGLRSLQHNVSSATPAPETPAASATNTPVPPPTPDKPNAAVATTGGINVVTTPAGATVKLDGKKLSGVTPISQQNIPTGSHTLQITATGYMPMVRTVDVTPNGVLSTEITLQPATGTVKLSSVPTGADVFVDGTATNKKTPAEFNLSKGDHTFALRMQGYDEAGDLIEVTPGQTISFAPTLTASQKQGANPFRKMGRFFGGEDKGSISVTTSPQGAFVFINGRRLPGTTPLTMPIPTGRFYMAIRKPGYRPVQQPVTVEKGKTTTVNQNLTAKEE